MLKLCRSSMTVGVVILFGMAGLAHGLAGTAAAPDGQGAGVEFTADSKLKQPVGYRKWVYIGTPVTPNDLNVGEAPSLSSTPFTWTPTASPTTREPASSAMAP